MTRNEVYAKFDVDVVQGIIRGGSLAVRQNGRSRQVRFDGQRIYLPHLYLVWRQFMGDRDVYEEDGNGLVGITIFEEDIEKFPELEERTCVCFIEDARGSVVEINCPHRARYALGEKKILEEIAGEA